MARHRQSSCTAALPHTAPHTPTAKGMSLFPIFSSSSLWVKFHQCKGLNLLHVHLHGLFELGFPVPVSLTYTQAPVHRNSEGDKTPPTPSQQVTALCHRAAEEQDHGKVHHGHDAITCHWCQTLSPPPMGLESRTRRLISSCLSGADLAVAFIMVDV